MSDSTEDIRGPAEQKWAEWCEVQNKEFDARAQRRSPRNSAATSVLAHTLQKIAKTLRLRATDAPSKEDMHSKRVRIVAGVTLSRSTTTVADLLNR